MIQAIGSPKAVSQFNHAMYVYAIRCSCCFPPILGVNFVNLTVTSTGGSLKVVMALGWLYPIHNTPREYKVKQTRSSRHQPLRGQVVAFVDATEWTENH